MSENSESHLDQVRPEQAKRWLKDRAYPRQRPLKEEHIKFLARQMLDGVFDGCDQHIHSCRCQGRYYIVNGCHTLSAIVLAAAISEHSGHRLPHVEVMVQTTHCETMNDVDRHYKHADIGVGRTMKDVLRADDFYSRTQLSDSRVYKLQSAITILIRGFGPRTTKTSLYERSKDKKIELAGQWLPYAEAFFKLNPTTKGPCKSKSMNLLPVIAVGIVTVKHQPEKATDFWPKVADDSNLPGTDPRKKLHEYLYMVALGHSQSGRRKYNNEHVSRAIAQAWNHFFHGESLSRISVSDTTKPIKLDGTPLTGKSHHAYPVSC